jgi:hypothetical protein
LIATQRTRKKNPLKDSGATSFVRQAGRLSNLIFVPAEEEKSILIAASALVAKMQPDVSIPNKGT